MNAIGIDGSDGRKPHSFTLGKRRYAIGLQWMVAHAAKDVAAEAKKEAKEAGHRANLFAVRKNEAGAQYGLGRTADGLMKGSFSAAGAAANAIQGSFCAVFQVDKGWWFVEKRGEMLSVDGDCFYLDEAAVRARFDFTVGELDWEGGIIAPDGWHPAAIQASLEDLFKRGDAPKLRTISAIGGNALAIGMAVAIAALLGIGAQQFLAWQAEKAHELQMKIAQRKLEAEKKKDAAARKVTPPWPKFALPEKVVEACLGAFGKVQPDVPGWGLVGIDCSARTKADSQMKVEWSFTRMYGEEGWLDSWIRRKNGAELADAIVFAPSGDAADLGVPLAKLDARGDQQLGGLQEASLALVTAAQSVGTDFKIGKAIEVQAPQGVKKDQWSPPPWIQYPWTLHVGFADGWGAKFAQVPGMVVTGVSLDAKKAEYIFKGDLYVKRN